MLKKCECEGGKLEANGSHAHGECGDVLITAT